MAKDRSLMEENATWNLAPLYPNQEAYEKEFVVLEKEANHGFSVLNFYKKNLKNLAGDLLKTYFDYLRKFDRLHTYAHLLNDQNLADSNSQTLYKKIQALYNRFETETSWIEPAILSFSESEFKEMLSKQDVEPYTVFLLRLFRMKAHVLSAEEEKILALSSLPLQSISKAFSMINNTDLKFKPAMDSTGKEYELTHGTYGLYLKSSDRKLRETTFHHLHEAFLGFENTISEMLAGCVNQHIYFAQAKGYKSALEAALFPNQIDTEVYHQLLVTTKTHLQPLHRYLKLRKERLQVSQLFSYDLFVPLADEVDLDFPYDEAKDLVLNSLSPLGETYHQILKSGLNEQRWVDVYENKGKRSGAYSSGCYDSYPYILLNYQGTFSDVMTLSHEIGHSMHSYFSNQNQPYQTSSYSIFVAEVASTLNEELTFRYLLAKAKNSAERIYILSSKIDSIRSTLFRQTLFADFELQIHQMAEKQIPLTPFSLKELYQELNKTYYGSDLSLDPLLPLECLRIPHFYYNFYVYQYATGISAAYTLAEKILSKEKGALEGYHRFLSSGSSKFPLDLLKEAGVNMKTEEPVIRLIKRFDDLVTQLEKEFQELDQAKKGK